MPKTKAQTDNDILSASFRDPSGFLFSHNGVLYRQVNHSYSEHYNKLIDSGLYDELVTAGLLIPHQEVRQAPAEENTAFKVIQPEMVPFISYPYEWSFGQYKHAALATLSIQLRALKRGMSLKDASAYNIQFVRGKPVLIDTLSFEVVKKGLPWVAYKQFCQHFLAPLALMALKDVRLGQLMRVHIDGVPLDLASKLLSFSTRLNFGLLTHLHIHAGAQKRYADADIKKIKQGRSMRVQAMQGLIENLRSTVKKLNWKPGGTEWGNYYDITNYSEKAFKQKKDLISEWIARVQPSVVWDLGANNGEFSRIPSQAGIFTISSDIDPSAVEYNYRRVRKDKEKNLLPLLIDLTNSSPGLGWANTERESFINRGPADMVFALALIHHLAITNNVPLLKLAEYFASLGKWLVIEFVPKSDSQVKKLFRSREDIFEHYTKNGFEYAFGKHFNIRESIPIIESERTLYLLQEHE
ncbi:MAG: SAM-dependent methyltransferase [Anaerolineae bacterium]|nr:SAM-dependent methyltransferase [Anaerolineae bacterium]